MYITSYRFVIDFLVSRPFGNNTSKWLCHLSGGNALDRDLDEIFSQFSSHLLEIERHFLTANVVMCDLFIRIRTEDCARFFVASVARGGISDTLMHNVQELLTVLENNTTFSGPFPRFSQGREALPSRALQKNKW